MRGFVTAAVLLATLSNQVYAHAGQRDSDTLSSLARRRKSLGFGASHPNAGFRVPERDAAASFAPFAASDGAYPFDVARLFVDDLLEKAKLSLDTHSYKIRPDSYTDKNTGVSHVYFRQLVNGLEVADGDINVNVKDGAVLSYGNSFYTGPAPAEISSVDNHPHAEYCERLEAEFIRHQGQQLDGNQISMQFDRHANELQYLMESNCRHTDVPFALAEHSVNTKEIESALLQFMIAATPKVQLARDMLNKFKHYLSDIVLTTTHHLTPFEEGSTPELMLHNVPDTVNPVKARMAYVQVPDDNGSTSLQLVYKFEVEMQDNWYEAAVAAFPPHKVISVVDWASDSPMPVHLPETTSKKTSTPGTYRVFAWGINDPTEGNRTLEKENFDSLASPVGWHALPYANDPSLTGLRAPTKEFWRNTTTTIGNNVWAHEDWEGLNNWINNYRPDATDKAFDYQYNPRLTNKTDALDEAKKHINATVTQLFYTSNMVHDLYYRYGFDEVSGNFQQYNFERGGRENDAVITNAQDGSGYNNANMMTPPDGSNGRCRMYLWNTALPYRDGDFEAGIVIHELTHGLSTRLTGGPANSGCLGWGESGGMGEGWGDYLATAIRSTSNYSDYAMGAWAANRENGIRNYPYSLDDTINPSTYKTLDKPGYWGVHAVGEVWAEILWVASQKLITKHGFSDTLFPPKPEEDGTIPEGDFYKPREFTEAGKQKPLVPIHGNTLMVQLVINGMKLQPCNPSFFDARDAIIQADQVLTGGENFCALWEGFADRGLGPDARVEGRLPWGGGIRTNDFEPPASCL